MQEFSSVTASSYDADALAPLLNEKAAEGWSVVAIVSAGSNIVAYLEREASEDAPAVVADAGSVGIASGAEVADDDVTDSGSAVIDTDTPAADAAVDEVVADTLAEEAAETVDAGATPSLGDAAVAVETAAAASPVDEPAGWASEPESAIESAGAAVESASADAAESATQAADSAAESVGATADTASEAASDTATEAVADTATATAAATAAAQATAPESTVPAGWYADPSGRYELRYWDGTAWTEHVSRAGQQFTDPPVA